MSPVDYPVDTWLVELWIWSRQRSQHRDHGEP
jgi:hypothetical protein